MYRLTENGVLKIDENMHIPNEPLNRDWQEYLVWLSDGNTPEPIPGPTEEEVMRYNIDKRNNMLSNSDWIVTRHRDQVDAGLPTAFTDDQYSMVLQWRQALREMDFSIQSKPTAPEQDSTPDASVDDSMLDQSVLEHAKMVKMSLDNTPTLFVIWPPMPDFMQGMFDDYPPKPLANSTRMGY